MPFQREAQPQMAVFQTISRLDVEARGIECHGHS